MPVPTRPAEFTVEVIAPKLDLVTGQILFNGMVTCAKMAAPPGPYPLGLAVFDGVDPNGTWRLYTMDRLNDNNGAVDGGWTLDFTIPPGTLTTAPQVKGKADAGRTLTAVSGATGNGAAPSYQWNRCSARGTSCTPIAGATRSAYKPKSGDRGHRLTLTESAVTSGGRQS